jgi:hypothetical protein
VLADSTPAPISSPATTPLSSFKSVYRETGSTIKSDNGITRAEAVFYIFLYLGYKPEAENIKTNFSDDSNIPINMKKFIRTAVDKNIIHGYPDNTFRADEKMTRQSLVVMLMNAFNFKNNSTPVTFSDKDSIDQWAFDSIQTAVSLEIVCGYPDNTFRPKKEISREEIAVILTRAFN